MKIYDLSNYSKVFIVGGVKDDFKTLFYRLKDGSANKESIMRFNEQIKQDVQKFQYTGKKSKPRRLNDHFNNSIIIVSGDSYFGFRNVDYYEKKLININNLLVDINSHILFIRGNHDDPSYFNDKQFNLSNIKCVSDYSVIKTFNDNILCVGGAISLDRVWRIQQEQYIKRFNDNLNKTYWENEKAIYNENLLNEIIKNGINIDFIVTHSTPNFVESTNKEGLEEWIENDEALKEDIKEERNTFDKIYSYLLDNNIQLKGWYYSHFNRYNTFTSKEMIPFMGISEDLSFHSLYEVTENLNNETQFAKKTPKYTLGNLGNNRPNLPFEIPHFEMPHAYRVAQNGLGHIVEDNTENAPLIEDEGVNDDTFVDAEDTLEHLLNEDPEPFANRLANRLRATLHRNQEDRVAVAH